MALLDTQKASRCPKLYGQMLSRKNWMPKHLITIILIMNAYHFLAFLMPSKFEMLAFQSSITVTWFRFYG